MRAMVCLILLLAGAGAQEPELRVVAGFGGYAVDDQPMPVRIDVAAPGGPVVGTITIPRRLDDTLMPRELYTVSVDCPAGGNKRYWLTVPPQAMAVELTLEARFQRYGAARLAVPLEVLEPGRVLVAVVTPTRTGLTFLNRAVAGPTLGPLPGAKTAPEVAAGYTVANLGYDELPPGFAAYQSLDTLVLAGDGFVGVPSETKEAVRRWVRAGGRLILSGGVESAALWQDPVIAELSPVSVDGVTGLPLSEFAPLQQRYGGTWRAQGGSYAVSRFTVRRGRVTATPGGTPLIVDAPYGEGSVVAVAAAFDQPPLQGWSGQPALWADLARADGVGSPLPLSTWRSLRSGAARSTTSETPAAGLVAGFLLVYLVVLIPVQFTVLRRLDRRELAWIVTPAVVAAFSVGAYLIGTRTKGHELRMQTMSLLTARAGEPQGRLISTTVLFSPTKRRYDVGLPANLLRIAELAEQSVMSWGDDGLSQRGMLRIAQSAGETTLPQLGVDMWSVRLFGTEQVADLGGAVSVATRPEPDGLRVVVANRSEFDLLGAVVRADGGTGKLGDLAAGGRGEVVLDASTAVELPSLLPPPAVEPFDPTGLTEAAQQLLVSGPAQSMYSYDEPAAVLDTQSPAVWAWLQRADSPLRLELPGERREVCLVRIAFTIDQAAGASEVPGRLVAGGASSAVLTVQGTLDHPTVVAFALDGLTPAQRRRPAELRAAVGGRPPFVYAWVPAHKGWRALGSETGAVMTWELGAPEELATQGSVYVAFAPANEWEAVRLEGLRLRTRP